MEENNDRPTDEINDHMSDPDLDTILTEMDNDNIVSESDTDIPPVTYGHEKVQIHEENYEGLGLNTEVFANEAKPLKKDKNKLARALNKLKSDKKDEKSQKNMEKSVPKDQISILSDESYSDESDIDTDTPTTREATHRRRARSAKPTSVEREKSKERGRARSRDRPKHTKARMDRSMSNNSDIGLNQEYLEFKRLKQKEKMREFEKRYKQEMEGEQKRKNEREQNSMREAYCEKYGYPANYPFSDAGSEKHVQTDEQTERLRDFLPSKDLDKTDRRFRDYMFYKNRDNEKNNIPKKRNKEDHDPPSDSSSSADSSVHSFLQSKQKKDKDNKEYSEKKDGHNNIDKILGSTPKSEIEHLFNALKAQLSVGGNSQLDDILKYIPKNLTQGGFEPEKFAILKKQYGSFPSILTKDSNLCAFVRCFQDIGSKSPVSNTTYNAVLCAYIDEKLKNMINELDIDIMSITAKEFLTNVSNGIVAPPLSAQEYKRKFYRYMFTETDYANPTECILKLSSYLKKGGLSETQIYEDLRIKLHGNFVPNNSKSAFLVQTVFPENVHTLINYFTTNSHFISADREKQQNYKKRIEVNAVQTNGQTNQQAQVANNDQSKQIVRPIEDKTKEQPQAANQNYNYQPRPAQQQPPAVGPQANYGGYPSRPLCEHCNRPHPSNKCIRHPEPRVRTKNVKEYLKKLQDKRNQNGDMICLLCNEQTHFSINCPTYPGISPSQDPCSICERLGMFQKRHPESHCEVKEIAKN